MSQPKLHISRRKCRSSIPNERIDNATILLFMVDGFQYNYRLCLGSRLDIYSRVVGWLAMWLCFWMLKVDAWLGAGFGWFHCHYWKFVTACTPTKRSAWFPQWICMNVKYLFGHAYIHITLSHCFCWVYLQLVGSNKECLHGKVTRGQIFLKVCYWTVEFVWDVDFLNFS